GWLAPAGAGRPQPVLLLRVAPTPGGLELLDLDAVVALGLVQATGGGVVERLVAAAADVVGHPDLDAAHRRAGAAAGRSGWVGRVVAAAGGERQAGKCECGQADHQRPPAPAEASA